MMTTTDHTACQSVLSAKKRHVFNCWLRNQLSAFLYPTPLQILHQIYCCIDLCCYWRR